MLNDEGRKLIADQQERIDAMRALKKFSTRTASDSASATDPCARCLGSSMTEADRQLVANQRRNYNLPAGGVVYHNKAENEYLWRKAEPLAHVPHYGGDHDLEIYDTAPHLWQLVKQDKLSWNEYERRLEAVLRRDEAQAKRPKVSKNSKANTPMGAIWISFTVLVVIIVGLFGYAMMQDNLVNKLKHEQVRAQQVYRRTALYRQHQMRELVDALVTLQRKSP